MAAGTAAATPPAADSVLSPQTHLSLAALPTAPACARGHVRSVVREWGRPELADTAELLASELVTNAVRAAEGLSTRADQPAVPVVGLWITRDGSSVIVSVWDASDETPVRRDARPDQEGGWGLLLVESLGQEWGSYRAASGKVVWVRL
ncbi:MAG TPA: ATP-binding protein [Trebonia sp.]|jgi:anti-sigma regulatory factor (Ser/Thr protein kinase)|nr:ATP-binding protein [Trebonia sp.]